MLLLQKPTVEWTVSANFYRLYTPICSLLLSSGSVEMEINCVTLNLTDMIRMDARFLYMSFKRWETALFERQYTEQFTSQDSMLNWWPIGHRRFNKGAKNQLISLNTLRILNICVYIKNPTPSTSSTNLIYLYRKIQLKSYEYNYDMMCNWNVLFADYRKDTDDIRIGWDLKSIPQLMSEERFVWRNTAVRVYFHGTQSYYCFILSHSQPTVIKSQ